jgi:hypothetical protein
MKKQNWNLYENQYGSAPDRGSHTGSPKGETYRNLYGNLTGTHLAGTHHGSCTGSHMAVSCLLSCTGWVLQLSQGSLLMPLKRLN